MSRQYRSWIVGNTIGVVSLFFDQGLMTALCSCRDSCPSATLNSRIGLVSRPVDFGSMRSSVHIVGVAKETWLTCQYDSSFVCEPSRPVLGIELTKLSRLMSKCEYISGLSATWPARARDFVCASTRNCPLTVASPSHHNLAFFRNLLLPGSMAVISLVTGSCRSHLETVRSIRLSAQISQIRTWYDHKVVSYPIGHSFVVHRCASSKKKCTASDESCWDCWRTSRLPRKDSGASKSYPLLDMVQQELSHPILTRPACVARSEHDRRQVTLAARHP